MSQVAITETNRFSTFVKSKRSDDYRDLVAWQQWFVQRGIPAVIASTSSGYALYRQGLIEVDIHDTETTVSAQRSHS
ncbi:MAG: hypothetical protein IPK14_11460 [Blastocatellia bacterium]|jgi:hypothetical protein|nr:hypothetical protein [Blastocatellia bacterium]MBL8193339.1 hypothetical protein [Blastocatellia bacterium]MBN8723973.1 hypothetical protein [Acidobacteriota bacterium]